MDFKDKNNDDFRDLDRYVKNKNTSSRSMQFSKSDTSAVEINADNSSVSNNLQYSDSKLSPKKNDNTITRFVPPHNDSAFAKKFTLKEYFPANPLIKSVKVCSDKQNDKIFADNNLFIRERRALLNRKGSECAYASYYSYSPRYSQMSRAQLNWYLWWRENTRNGIFLKTDESYIILYAYELVATGDGEDIEKSLDMLCSLYNNYSDKDISVVFHTIIKSIICDFCLLHALTPPIEKLKILDRQLLLNAFLPEFFIDLSEKNRQHTIDLGLTSLSMYDYRRSKFYSEETAQKFKDSINQALSAVINDERAFRSITSFTEGVYGCVTAERRPFSRMVNIVNKSIRLEIEYFQLSSIQAAITDAVRYSENKLREHLGIKNKLHIMSVNPYVKEAIDRFFEVNYPAIPTVDRRRKNNSEKAAEVNEYDKLYDVPKTEISPKRAFEIEQESWSTTKILIEAFENEHDDMGDKTNATKSTIEPIFENSFASVPDDYSSPQADINSGSLSEQLCAALGDIADFIELCKNASALEQRKFASSHSLSVDEVADKINESAVDIFGDIVLEDDGGTYRIIEDYKDRF